jgi:hypothetical protein
MQVLYRVTAFCSFFSCLMVASLVLVAASRMTTLSADDFGTDTVTLTGCTPQLFRLAIVCCISNSFLPVQLLSLP